MGDLCEWNKEIMRVCGQKLKYLCYVKVENIIMQKFKNQSQIKG